MQISEVTQQDGIQMAHILTALKIARFDGVTGDDMAKYHQAKQWLSSIAGQMAEQLKSKSKPADSGFRIKSMGSLPETGKIKKKSKK